MENVWNHYCSNIFWPIVICTVSDNFTIEIGEIGDIKSLLKTYKSVTKIQTCQRKTFVNCDVIKIRIIIVSWILSPTSLSQVRSIPSPLVTIAIANVEYCFYRWSVWDVGDRFLTIVVAKIMFFCSNIINLSPLCQQHPVTIWFMFENVYDHQCIYSVIKLNFEYFQAGK